MSDAQTDAERDLAALRLVATPAFVVNEDGLIRLATDSAARLLSVRSAQLEGRSFASLHDSASEERVRSWLATCRVDRGSGRDCLADMRLPDASRLAACHRACPVPGTHGGLLLIQTSRVESAPTGLLEDSSAGAMSLMLPRATFERQLGALLADKHRGTACLLQIDIDHFKVLTDRLGTAAGQTVTEVVARTLVDELPSHLVVARGGVESFLVFLRGTELQEATRIAHSVCRAVRAARPVFNEEPLHVSVSIGIVELRPGVFNSADALCSVDTATHEARETGGNAVRSFQWDDSVIIRSTRAFNELPRLQTAIETGGFVLYFQPIQPVGNRPDPLSGEVLIRMLDDSGTLRGPGSFLPVAERYGLSADIDRFTLRTALTWLAANPTTADNLGYIAINLSGQTLCDRTACDWFEGQVRAHPSCATKLCFEITETVLIRNLAPVRGFLERMSALGCRFALDDFGTGFSSLGYLQSLPVDLVKIDGAFVRGCDEDPRVRTLLTAINDLCHMLGKRTVAEFAETPRILDVLGGIGVDYAQGFAVSHPFPLNEVPARFFPRAAAWQLPLRRTAT